MFARVLIGSAVCCGCMFTAPLAAGAAEILHYEESIFDTSVDPMNGLAGMYGVIGIGLSPNGEHLYAVGAVSSMLTQFDRNPLTGTLTFHQSIANSEGTCWASELLPGGTTRNAGDAFKAKAP